MPSDGFDKASIVTQGIARPHSPIWSKIPESGRNTSMTLDDLCSYLGTTTDKEHSLIEKLIIRKEEKGFEHEFVLILLCKPSGGDFWVRLARRRPEGFAPMLISSLLGTNDAVGALIDD